MISGLLIVLVALFQRLNAWLGRKSGAPDTWSKS